ncbi:unnamed protein product, partial [Dicrocoelium dendriticum]
MKLFSNCTFVALRKLDTVPWYSLRIAMNEKKLPSWYRHMSEFEQVWFINIMLNANTKGCGTAVTTWKKNYVNDYKLNELTSVST